MGENPYFHTWRIGDADCDSHTDTERDEHGHYLRYAGPHAWRSAF